MRIFISIVSHGHCSLIKEIGLIQRLSYDFELVIKSNKPGDDFSSYSHLDKFHWLDGDYGLGFGANNNVVFEYCNQSLGMTGEDYFLVINPDVDIELSTIQNLVSTMQSDKVRIAAINLFKDSEYEVFDCSIRNFPTFYTFSKSMLGLGNDSILDKSSIHSPIDVDWASGSFLAFLSSHYHALGGFDEKYFMYCEDVDICFRSKLLGSPVRYFPSILAIHHAQHANRNVFSKHFVWHLHSAYRFLRLQSKSKL
ncbi:glycosyltransferase family 2 protein [Vibrio parahaemolyticus]|uniref:glycosyltransferase family 2 protein n=1 Tax=Vibrio parahaemolyticus TaxID=670 RepID=UPI00226AFF0C|nr:glycosyltransferase family 2 protein [Vibrio parahaemolyticus]MCX8809346.1 glycosyltransferase family 2 protein [Vibrio parahaemolyticus]